MQAWAALAAALSSTLGGSAIVATRFAVQETDPLTLVFLRFLGAGLIILAFTLPRYRLSFERRDLPPLVALGALQFSAFPLLFTLSLQHVSAARGALVLSLQPLLTLFLSTALRREQMTFAKLSGCLLASAGVAVALGERGFSHDDETWKGDLYMFGAAAIGSIYNTLSGVFLRKYPAPAVAALTVPAGALAVFILLLSTGDLSGFGRLSPAGWSAIVYLMTFGGAATFFLWIWALEHTTPSRVSVAVTLNPVSAAFLAAVLLNEPIGWRLAVGLVATILGIAVANWSSLRRAFARA